MIIIAVIKGHHRRARVSHVDFKLARELLLRHAKILGGGISTIMHDENIRREHCPNEAQTVLSLCVLQRSAKRSADFVKRQPGRARRKS